MIHPALFRSMMGGGGDDEDASSSEAGGRNSRRQEEEEIARKNMEKAVAQAKVVMTDHELNNIGVGGGDEGEDDENNSTNRRRCKNRWCSYSHISSCHWFWILFHLLWSCYIVTMGSIMSCQIDTLRGWAITWGILILMSSVIFPLKGWRITEGFLTAYGLMYIWGLNALVPYFDEQTKWYWSSADKRPQQPPSCDGNLFFPCFWSLLSSLGFFVVMTCQGLYQKYYSTSITGTRDNNNNCPWRQQQQTTTA